MRISQKLEYACRAMVQLAQHYDGQTLTRLDDLAQREAVSANFLVQILNDLKRGDLIISRRGKAGGYLLARDPREINLLQITRAVEPGIITPNVSNDGESGRTIHQAWDRIHQTLVKELSSVTLDTLGTQSPMFYI
jgi:Rrf2 family cysteine metabolism transcriptional repressor